MKILITEEEINFCLILRRELSRLGHEVTVVRDSEAAIRAARETEFDVVLLGLLMPGGNGLDVLRELRQREQPPEVLMMTAHATTESAIQAMKLGAYDYLTKPLHIRELEALINKAYEKRKDRRAIVEAQNSTS